MKLFLLKITAAFLLLLAISVPRPTYAINPAGCISVDTQIYGRDKCPADHPVRCPGSVTCCQVQSACLVVTPVIYTTNNVNVTCSVPGQNTQGINTALGCIPINNLNTLIAWLLSKVLFIVSGVGFILLVIAAFQILTSSGNPDKVKAGSELIASTITGIFFVILSLFLLKLIGFDILHLPGFGQ